MSEELDREVQQWFMRSDEESPQQPFMSAMLERVHRRERRLRWQRHAAMLAMFAGCCLLLPELVAPLGVLINTVGALPLVMAETGGEQWLVLFLMGVGAAFVMVRQARSAGFLRRSIFGP